MTSPVIPPPVEDLDLYQRADRNIRESAIGYALLFAAIISVLTTVAIVYILASETFNFFRTVKKQNRFLSYLYFLIKTDIAKFLPEPIFGGNWL